METVVVVASTFVSILLFPKIFSKRNAISYANCSPDGCKFIYLFHIINSYEQSPTAVQRALRSLSRATDCQ